MPASKTVSLQEVLDHLEAQRMPAELIGEPSRQVSAVNTLEDAGPGELSFLANPKYEKHLATTAAGAVILGRNVHPPESMTVIRSEDPYAAVTAVIGLIHGRRQHPQWGVHESASVSAKATVGPNANIGPHCTIEDGATIGDNAVIYPGCYVGNGTHIGNNVILYPSVVIYEESRLGNNVAVHAGTIIGEDGLGYAPTAESWMKIPHAGNVIIEDDVEIGSNCTIDRATLGSTVIGRGSKFSNLIAIGHGTRIGPNAMFVAQVGLAGTVTVGERVQMGGQVGVLGHVTIGDRASIGAKAGVANDVDPGAFVLGQPAVKASDAKRAYSLTYKLPEMKQRIKALENEVAELKAAITANRGEGAGTQG